MRMPQSLTRAACLVGSPGRTFERGKTACFPLNLGLGTQGEWELPLPLLQGARKAESLLSTRHPSLWQDHGTG